MTARAAWAEHFRNVDVFISPVAFTPTIEHDARPFEQRRITASDGAQRPYNDLPFWTAHAALSRAARRDGTGRHDRPTGHRSESNWSVPCRKTTPSWPSPACWSS